MGENVFGACIDLTSVTIQDGIKAIPLNAFASCTNLSRADLPASVTSLEAASFSNCTRLTDIYYHGTEDGWNRVSKGRNWDLNAGSKVGGCKVHCRCTVSFDANGHGQAPSAYKTWSNETISAPSKPTAAGYAFTGWYKEPECTNLWDFGSDLITGDTTLYAGWKEDPNATSEPAENVCLSKPKSVKLTAVSAKKIKVSWKKLSAKDKKKIKKIQIQVSLDKSFSKLVKEKIVSSGKTSWTIPGLKKNTKYYVRIRAYTKSGNELKVSKWVVKSKKTKKK